MFDRVGGAVIDGCGRRDGGGLLLVRHCRTSSRHGWGDSAAPGGLNRTSVVSGVPRTLNGRCRDEVGKQLVRRVSLRGEPNESPLTALCTPPLARPLHCATAVCSHRIAAPLTAPRTVTAAIPLSHTSFLIPSLLPPCRPPPLASPFCSICFWLPPSRRRSTRSRTPARPPASPACRRRTSGGRGPRVRPTRAPFGDGSG